MQIVHQAMCLLFAIACLGAALTVSNGKFRTVAFLIGSFIFTLLSLAIRAM